MKKTFYRTTIDTNIKISNLGSFQKAVSNYLHTMPVLDSVESNEYGEWIQSLEKLVLKQPDLMYNVSILVSEGKNKNKDGFLRKILASIYQTPRNKFVDYEHDVEAENRLKNPKSYKVIGHIYDSSLSLQNSGEIIPEYDVYIDKDGEWFSQKSKWRNQPLDIVVAWVLYKYQYPEIADLLVQNLYSFKDDGFGVSMEVLFSDYKFRVGSFDTNEDFDFDATTIGAIEAKRGTDLGLKLEKLWKKRELYNGQEITRILGGEIFFSGMAITHNRANYRSLNLAAGNAQNNDIEDKDLLGLIKIVASRNPSLDLNSCEIVNGQPSCDCLESTIYTQIEELSNSVAEILTQIDQNNTKSNENEDNFDEEELNNLENYLKTAQKKLVNLYENNIDYDLSSEEIMEFLEEIEDLVQKSRAFLQKALFK